MPTAGPDHELAKLSLDYETAVRVYEQLADIRFKLVGFVQPLSVAAVALVAGSKRIDDWGQLGLSALGAAVTFAIVVYDQRNTQLYNGAIARATWLEKRLELPRAGGDFKHGLFGSREDFATRHLFWVPVRHDLALGIVYAAVLGAWVFVGVVAFWSEWIALIAGGAVVGTLFVQFLWHDRQLEPLRTRWERRVRVKAPIVVATTEEDFRVYLFAQRDDCVRALREQAFEPTKTTTRFDESRLFDWEAHRLSVDSTWDAGAVEFKLRAAPATSAGKQELRRLLARYVAPESEDTYSSLTLDALRQIVLEKAPRRET